MAKPLWVDVFGKDEGEASAPPAEKPTQVAEVFKLRLPDGRSIKVDAPTRDAAIKAANNFWKKQKGGSGERGETASPSGGGMASPPPAAPAPAAKTASDEGGGISDYVPSFIGRGVNRLQRDVAAATGALGGDPAAAAEAFVRNRREEELYQYDEDVLEAFKELPSHTGIADRLSWHVRHPKATGVMLGDQAVNIAISTAGTLLGAGVGAAAGSVVPGVGTAAGGIGGATLGSGLASGGTEFAATLSDFLAEKGIDLDDENQVAGAFANEVLMGEAKERAVKRGIAVGAIDSFVSLLGMKGAGKFIGSPVEKVVQKTTKSGKKSEVGGVMAETMGNVVLEATGGAAGEATATLWTEGRINVPEVVTEFILEVPGSVPEAGFSTYTAIRNRTTNATPEQVGAAFAGGAASANAPQPPPPPKPKTFEEARVEGRTWYGYIEPGSEERNRYEPVTSSYRQAEGKAGRGPLDRGRLVAVKEDDVVAIPLRAQEKLKGMGENAVAGLANGNFTAADATALVELAKTKPVEEFKGAYEDAVEKGLRIPPEKGLGLYVGDYVGIDIEPELAGNLLITSEKEFKVSQGERGVQEWVDRRVVEAELAKDPAAVVPNRGTIRDMWRNPNHRVVLEETFEGITEELVQEIEETPGNSVFETALKNGTVKWKQWDPRVANPGSGADISPTLRAQSDVKETGGEFPRSGHEPDSRSRWGQNKPEPWEKGFEKPGTYFHLELVDPKHHANMKNLFKVLETFRRKLMPEKKILFVPMDEIPSTFRITGYPTQLRTMLEDIIKSRESDAAFAAISQETGILMIRPGRFTSALTLISGMMHEFGHGLSWARFSTAPLFVQQKIYGAYRRFIEGQGSPGSRRRRLQLARTKSAPGLAGMMEMSKVPKGATLDANAPLDLRQDYLFSFEEWFAEQVARWATTTRAPLGVVGRFFQGVYRDFVRLVKMAAKFLKINARDFRPEVEVQQWLDELYTGKTRADWFKKVQEENDNVSQMRNRAFEGESATPDHPASSNVDAIFRRFFGRGQGGGTAPPGAGGVGGAQIGAGVDKFNWFLEWAVNFRQLADLKDNQGNVALQSFKEWIQLAQRDANEIMGVAEQRIKEWRRLRGKDMGGRLTAFLYDLNNMVYLTPAEQRRGVRRWPTAAEFQTLVQNHQLSGEALTLYQKIRDDFLRVLDRTLELQLAEATRIANPQAQQIAIAQAYAMDAKLRASPYFPMTRFGKWALTIRDGNGHIQAFETFETKREQQRAYKAFVNDIANVGLTGTMSVIPDEAMNFQGVPPWLIDKILLMPGLSNVQKDWLQQLRYQLAPVTSYRKHLLKRKGYDGYSLDGRRVYARYFFAHARFYARAKYENGLTTAMDALKQAFTQPGDQDNRTRIGNFLQRTYNEFMNPSKDWALFRNVAAIFHLGFVPASAMLNMTQTFVMTWPFLASKFGKVGVGDAKAMAALMRAAGDVTSYYKRGNLANIPNHEIEALALAFQEGFISESMAAELASLSVGSGTRIAKSVIGDKVQGKWIAFSEKAMMMFQLVEQWNRRVSFRAAYRLAYDNPTTPWLQELRQKHFLQYTRLIQLGWTNQRALAFLAGKETVMTTHFTYDKLSRPRFMQGRKSALFMFYMFTQNTVFALATNKSMAIRWALIMTALAGPFGLVPDDIEDILDFIGRRYFGKDFSLQREARQFIIDMFGEDPTIPPDMLLHGVGRYGFGIPHFMDMVGASWFPNFDRSQAVSLQRIIPASPTKFLESGGDWNKALADTTQSVAGAAFSIPIGLMKAAMASDLEITDFKRWESAMPRAMRSAVRAFRIGKEGGERDRNYNQNIEFDMDNTEHVAELVGMAMGYNPTRMRQHFDREQAKFEVQTYWEIQRKLLLDEFYRNRFHYEDRDEVNETKRRIKEFNKSVPDGKLRISGDTIRRSMETRNEAKRKIEKTGTSPRIKRGIDRQIDLLYPEVIDEKKVQ